MEPDTADSVPGDFECPVCHEEYTEPKILPCTHRTCKKCLLSWLQAKDNMAGCPLCRVPVLPPAQKQSPGRDEAAVAAMVDKLPTDLCTMALVESRNALSGERLCSVCEDDMTAASFCFDCNIRLCKTCAKVHAKLPVSSDHLLESLSTLTAERLAASRPSLCHMHNKRHAELYCSAHEALICMLCATSTHRSCSGVISVTEVAKQERAQLADQARKLRRKEAEFASQISQLEKEVRDAQAHFSTMRAEVKSNCERLQQTVTKRRQELTSAIKEQEDAFLSSKTATKSALEEQKTAMAAHASTVEELVVSASDSALLGMARKMKERLAQLESQTRCPVEGKDGGLGSVTFDIEMLSRLEKAVAACGRISSQQASPSPSDKSNEDNISLASADSSVKPVSDGTWLYVPFNEDFSPPAKVAPVEEPKFATSFSAKTPNDSCEANISSMALAGGNILVMTDTANNAVKAMSLSKSGGGVASFSFPPFVPCCVATLEGGKVAMTLYSGGSVKFRGIRLLEVTAQPVRIQVLHTVTTVKPYRGICAGPDSSSCQTLIVTCAAILESNVRREATIDVISRKDGKVLRSVSPELTSQVLHSPYSICSDGEGFLFVTDSAANKVWKLIENRELEAPRSTDLPDPRQVTTDEEGRTVYMVCDRRVLVRTNETKWRVLLEGGRLTEAGKLQAVCISRKNLYVAGHRGDGKLLKFSLK